MKKTDRTYDSEIKKCFSDRIHAIMADRNMKTYSEIYNNLSISQPRFSDLVNGKNLINVKEALEIADFLELPVDYLINPNYEIENKKKNDDSWKDWTCRDVLNMLIELDLNNQLTIIHTKRETGYCNNCSIYTHIDHACMDTCDHADCISYFFKNLNDKEGLEYIHNSFARWLEISKPLKAVMHRNNYMFDSLMYTKNNFVNSIDDRPFFELPFLPKEDEELPFN